VPSRLLLNPHLVPSPSSVDPSAAGVPPADRAPATTLSALDLVRAFHRRLPGYAPTALHDLPELASACGVGRVLVKAEVERLGLPSFKVLGASWATYRLLCHELHAAGALPELGTADAGRAAGPVPEPEWASVDDLADVVGRWLGPLRLVAATDGNHGRAVAHMARLCRLAATILVPEGTAQARIDAIAGEGAEVLVVDGTYDDAVFASAAFAAGDDSVRRNAVAVVGSGEDAQGGNGTAARRLTVSDTSWTGYEDVPGWVIDGYSTIFSEIDEQLPELGVEALDLVVVPLGVGALGAAVATHYGAQAPAAGPLLVGVEPDTAACVAAAVEAGKVVEIPGPHGSIMVGLNCGLASPVAFPRVKEAFGAFVAVDDDRCRDAMRALAASGLDVGETGAATLAGLTALADEHRPMLPLTPHTTVLLLATEGVTDPFNFQNVVGRPPTRKAGST
jgi:diaminopropionate ammonia-lyase